MTALLELPSFRQRVHLMSVEEYHRAGEAGIVSRNVELLRGIVVTKTSKSPLHEQVCERLMELLAAQLPPDLKLRKEGPLTLRDSEPEPDLSVVKRSTGWEQTHPATALLVIEIAISSFDVDENKAFIYAEAGIPEFWLVRPEARTVNVYSEPTASGYAKKTSLSERDTIRSITVPSLEASLSAILPPR